MLKCLSVCSIFVSLKKLLHMRKVYLLLLGLCALAACSRSAEPATGRSQPDLGWLFLDKAPYTLETQVKAAPGPADICLVKDLSLMAPEPEVVFSSTTPKPPPSVASPCICTCSL